MNNDLWPAFGVVLLGGVGTYLLMPHGHGARKARPLHLAGALLVLVATVLLLRHCASPGAFLASIFFYGFSIAAVLGGVLMITSVNPVHSALWFAAVVLATTGLFLLSGAQFLAAATIIIYAGAIIVTFLFVLMLAQSSGQAAYDRTARAPGRAVLSCFLLLWALIYAVGMAGSTDVVKGGAATSPLRTTATLASAPGLQRGAGVGAVLGAAVPARARIKVEEVLIPGVPPPHVAALGATLFTDHLISVQIAGVLLFIALVGAAAITGPKGPVRPSRGMPAGTR